MARTNNEDRAVRCTKAPLNSGCSDLLVAYRTICCFSVTAERPKIGADDAEVAQLTFRDRFVSGVRAVRDALPTVAELASALDGCALDDGPSTVLSTTDTSAYM